MIVLKQKPLDWILDRIKPYQKVAVLGCGTCATVCFAGGERQVEEMCCSLQIAPQNDGRGFELEGLTCKRVCEWEFIEPVSDLLRTCQAVLSLACGAGSNLLAEKLYELPVIPGVDTTFIGANTGPDSWKESCAACGDCIIDQTFGICPVAGCAKTILNGPCGGSKDGKCEINAEVDCAWAKIVEKAEALGRIEELERLVPPKDWSSSRHGGQRSLKRPDLGIRRICSEEFDEI